MSPAIRELSASSSKTMASDSPEEAAARVATRLAWQESKNVSPPLLAVSGCNPEKAKARDSKFLYPRVSSSPAAAWRTARPRRSTNPRRQRKAKNAKDQVSAG